MASRNLSERLAFINSDLGFLQHGESTCKVKGPSVFPSGDIILEMFSQFNLWWPQMACNLHQKQQVSILIIYNLCMRFLMCTIFSYFSLVTPNYLLTATKTNWVLVWEIHKQSMGLLGISHHKQFTFSLLVTSDDLWPSPKMIQFSSSE